MSEDKSCKEMLRSSLTLTRSTRKTMNIWWEEKVLLWHFWKNWRNNCICYLYM